MSKNKQFIFEPKDGWKQQTYYVVEIAMNANNPIHLDIFYTGFLSFGFPAGYNNLNNAECSIQDVYYIKAIRAIDSNIENDGKMMSDIYPEYFV